MSSSPAHLRVRRPTDRYRYVRLRWHVLFGIVDLVGDLVRGWLRLPARGGIAKRSHAPRRVLLIQLDHLGDAVITAAILPALRKQWPDARIEVLAAPWNREIFEHCPAVDSVHESRVNRFARGWRPHWILAVVYWGLRLRRSRFDVGIDVRGEFPFAALLWLAGIKRRVGWDCGGGGFLLTDSAKFVPGRPEMQSRMALLALLGVDLPDDLQCKSPWFIPSAAARAKVRDKLMAGVADFVRSPVRQVVAAQNSHEFRYDPRIVFHIGAGTAAKRWPVDRWRELLGRMIVEYGSRIVLVGGANDRATARAILDGKATEKGDRYILCKAPFGPFRQNVPVPFFRPDNAWPGVSDWTGELSVVETAALIEQADLFIGADSGPAHLAAAVGTPAIVLFSGTNRVRQWRPWGRSVVVVKHDVSCSPCHRRTCPLSNHPCMNGILPETIMHQAQRILNLPTTPDTVPCPLSPVPYSLFPAPSA